MNGLKSISKHLSLKVTINNWGILWLVKIESVLIQNNVVIVSLVYNKTDLLN
jgi:hypothetical protein